MKSICAFNYSVCSQYRIDRLHFFFCVGFDARSSWATRRNVCFTTTTHNFFGDTIFMAVFLAFATINADFNDGTKHIYIFNYKPYCQKRIIILNNR